MLSLSEKTKKHIGLIVACAVMPIALVVMGVIVTSLRGVKINPLLWFFIVTVFILCSRRMETRGVRYEDGWREEKRKQQEKADAEARATVATNNGATQQQEVA